MAPTIDTGDIFRIRNDHETEELKVGIPGTSRKWAIKPGETALVPFELIRVHWGDPRSRPGVYTRFADSLERGYINKREDEIRRLGVWYGSYATTVEELNSPAWPMGHVNWGAPKVCPHPISVQTEHGDKIIPACFDETGEEIYPGISTESEDLTDQLAYREHLERQLDEIRHELRALQGAGESDAEVDDAGRR